MNQGEIIEIGNHKELMQKKGLYHHLTTIRLMDDSNMNKTEL